MGARRRQYRQAQVYAAFAGGGLPRVIAHYKHRAMAPVRWFQAARTHPIQCFAAVLFLYLWNATGHFLLAIVLTAAIVPAGIALWFEYRRRRTGLTYKQAAQQIQMQKRIKARWAKACIAGGITANKQANGGVTIPPLTKIAADKGDVTARIYTGQYAIPSTDVAKNLVRIAETIGCREVTMRTANSGVVDLRFCYTNPLDKVVTPTDIQPIRPGAAPYGLTDGGATIGLSVVKPTGEVDFTPVLVGGVTGAGKSSALWAILAGFIVQKIPVRLWVIDPAGGVELAALGEAYRDGIGTDWFKVERYISDPDEAPQLFKDFKAAMDERLAAMVANRVREHTPAPDAPMHILICDELLQMGDTMLKGGVHSPFGKVMSAGRKGGFSTICLTQIGEKSAIGGIRELFKRRICFATETREQTETIIGSGGKADLAPAHHISENTPGVGYAYADGTRGLVKFRAAYFNNDHAQQIAMGEVPTGMGHLIDAEPEPESLFALYRLNTFPLADGSRRRLYIGISNEPARRFDEHRRDKRWAKQVDWADAAQNLAWYPTRADALAAEAEAIRDELPVHNKVHNQDNPARELDEVAA